MRLMLELSTQTTEDIGTMKKNTIKSLNKDQKEALRDLYNYTIFDAICDDIVYDNQDPNDKNFDEELAERNHSVGIQLAAEYLVKLLQKFPKSA